MRVVWTDRAKQRLREIHDTITKDKPLAAQEVVRRLVLRSTQLATLPHSGSAVPEYAREDVRQLLERPYRIIYAVRTLQARIDVLTVYHYRQLLPSDLGRLR